MYSLLLTSVGLFRRATTHSRQNLPVNHSSRVGTSSFASGGFAAAAASANYCWIALRFLCPGLVRRELLVRTGNTGRTKQAPLTAVGQFDGDAEETTSRPRIASYGHSLPFLRDLQ